MSKMVGAILPGNSTTELKDFDIPVPKHGEVLIKDEIIYDLRIGYSMHLS